MPSCLSTLPSHLKGTPNLFMFLHCSDMGRVSHRLLCTAAGVSVRSLGHRVCRSSPVPSPERGSHPRRFFRQADTLVLAYGLWTFSSRTHSLRGPLSALSSVAICGYVLGTPSRHASLPSPPRTTLPCPLPGQHTRNPPNTLAFCHSHRRGFPRALLAKTALVGPIGRFHQVQQRLECLQQYNAF